jgi:hypothetical protein
MKSYLYKCIVIFIYSISFCSCVENNKVTYTVTGKFVDGTNPSNKFANLKLTFEDCHNHKKLVTLGETVTDDNGNFKFSYDYSSSLTSNSLRILVDSSFFTAKKLSSLELGSNWSKIFNLGDSAIFDLHINSSLEKNDTLYFNTWDSLYILIGPCSSGFAKRFKAFNYNEGEYVSFGVGFNNYIHNTKISSYSPTGEPIADKLYLNLLN